MCFLAWSLTGSMNVERRNHAATILRNGKVLVTGGVSNSKYGVSEFELYDPTTGNWTNAGQTNFGRYGHTSSLLSDGTVLIAGGSIHDTGLKDAELYDPMKNVWSTD